MNKARAVYSLIQYVPDRSRAEGANVGVVIFDPQTGAITTRLSDTLSRVKKFFSPRAADFQSISQQLKSIQYRLEIAQGEFSGEADFAQFAASRADSMRLTAPKLIMIGELSSDLESLYHDLIGEYTETPLVENLSPEEENRRQFPKPIRAVLEKLEKSGRIWRPKSIQLPVIGRKFKVEAAYENGVTNYIRAENLAQGRKIISRLPQLGFSGRLISHHKIANRDSRLVVVSSTPNANPQTEEDVEQTLKEFDVRFVAYNDASKFANEIESSAHPRAKT